MKLFLTKLELIPEMFPGVDKTLDSSSSLSGLRFIVLDRFGSDYVNLPAYSNS